MEGRVAGSIGIVAGCVGMLAAGLVDRYTEILLLCGTILAAAGIIGLAISTKSGKGSD